MEERITALCVRTADIGEKDKLLTLISAEAGKRSVRIRSVKSPASKLKAAAQELAYCEYTLEGKGKTPVVTGAAPLKTFFGCWEKVDKSAAASIVAETLDKATIEGADCRAELRLALETLGGIEYLETTPFVVAERFLVGMFAMNGLEITEEAGLPVRTLQYCRSLAAATLEDLEVLDVSEQEVVTTLGFLGELALQVFGSRIRSVSEAVKLFYR